MAIHVLKAHVLKAPFSLLFFLLAVLALAGTGRLSAQEDESSDDRILSDVRFDGLFSISENELRGLVIPYIDNPYSEDVSWEIQSKLYALEYFDLIIPELEIDPDDPGSFVLILQLQEKPQINQILFEGNTKTRRSELLDVVKIGIGDLLNSGSLNLDTQAITDLYKDKGFINSTVSSDYTVNDETNKATVTFTITEGSQTKITEIRFVGNSDRVSEPVLRRQMKTKPQSLFSRGLYVETKLQEDVKALERHYGDLGFIDMKVADVKKEIVYDEEKNLNKMIITIVIEEGEQWNYGGIEFVGNKVYSDAELQGLVTQVPGDTYNLTKFQLDYARINNLYLDNGYIFNSFTYEEVRNDENREVFYRVNIVERDRAHIEKIIVKGNTKTRNYVITRELPFTEGEVFSRSGIVQGISNLYNLQFFGSIEPNVYPSENDGLMDVIIDVSEGKTTDVGLGLTVSGGGDFPISGQVSWRDRNFLGRNQVLGASVSASPDRVSASATFSEPRLFGLRLAGGFDVAYSWSKTGGVRQDRDLNGIPDPFRTSAEYESEGATPNDEEMTYKTHNISTGFNTGYTWVTPLGRIGLSSSLRFIWQYVYYNPNSYTPFNSTIRDNLDNWKYSDRISFRASWDTRDLQYDPNSGFILSQTYSIAGWTSLGNRHNQKFVTRFNINQVLWDIPTGKKNASFKSVISLNTSFSTLLDGVWRSQKGGVVDTDGFLINGFFIARGWPPSSERYKFLWDNSLQIKTPIIPNILAFDLFLDAVGGWENDNSLKSEFWKGENWFFSLGGGLRFANPQFPIAVYLVKRFQWQNGRISWFPDRNSSTGERTNANYEFKGAGMDVIIAFSLDIY